MMDIWPKIKSGFRQIPLLGKMVDCRRKDYSSALAEFFVNAILSATPIWLGGMLVKLFNTSMGWKGAFLSTFSGGELFIYSTATLAPVAYLTLRDEEGSRRLHSGQGRLIGGLMLLITYMICVAFFSALRSKVTVDIKLAFLTSVILYILSLFLYYLTLVYESYRLTGAADASREQEQEFSDSYKGRH